MWSNWLGDRPCPHSRSATSNESSRITSTTGRSADTVADPLRVLVVGDTVSALVLTRLLEHEGHAPTLIRRRSDDTTAAAVTLVPPAVTAIDELVDGVLDAVPVSKLHVEQKSEARSYAAPGVGQTPLLLNHRLVRRRLRRAISYSNRQTAQVAGLHVTENGVETVFTGDERETFDLVVGADGPHSFIRILMENNQENDDGIQEWAFRVPRPGDWPPGVVESWHSDAVVTAAPVDDNLAIRLGVHGMDGRQATGSDVAAEALSNRGGRLGNIVDSPPGRASYRRLPDPESNPGWRADRVAFCGNAAAPVGQLSGLAPSLGVEDAVMLVEALAESSSVQAALDSYADDRSDRLRAIRTAADNAAVRATKYPPLNQSGMLGRLAKLRGIGFLHVIDDRYCR